MFRDKDKAKITAGNGFTIKDGAVTGGYLSIFIQF